MEIGNRLIAVKDALDHGAWLPWLDEQFGWSERRAAPAAFAVSGAHESRAVT